LRVVYKHDQWLFERDRLEKPSDRFKYEFLLLRRMTSHRFFALEHRGDNTPPWFGDDGQPLGYFGVCQRLTERTQSLVSSVLVAGDADRARFVGDGTHKR
jgi:hypothetical protein